MASYAAGDSGARPGAHRRGRHRARLVDLQARERAPARRDRRRGHRHRRGREQGHQEPAQDLRHAARPAQGQVHRHHRGDPREGHRQVRQARRRGRRHHALDQPVRDARQQGHDGAEGRQRHHHRPAADGLGGHASPPSTACARELDQDRPAGGPRADPAQSGDARVHHAADGARRPGGRHRQPGQRAPGLQVRQAGTSASASATRR